jgi:hypothetical protein
MRTTIRLTGRADVALPPALEDRLLDAFRGWQAS